LVGMLTLASTTLVALRRRLRPVPTAGQGKRSPKARRPRRTVTVTLTICPGTKTLVRAQGPSPAANVYWYNAAEPIVSVVADLLNRGY
jgi:hypothetical protein